MPLPLGGIAIKRSLPDKIKKDIALLIKESIEFANKFPDASQQFIRNNAQETSEEITKKHIGLYVNEFSTNLGEKGKAAINSFLKLGFEKNICPKIIEPIFTK
jgi:1,4-dihydroxy-6-naphthoate synthase